MKKIILILLLFTGFLQAQTLQNPTYGNTTTNTLKIKAPATVTSVNFLPAFDSDGITVSKISTVYLPFVSQKTVSQIRSNTGVISNVYTTDAGKEGNWYYDPSDTSTADNTGTVLVTSDGKRLKRVLVNGIIDSKWFGTTGTESTDFTILNNARNSILNSKNKIVYKDKDIFTEQTSIPIASGALNARMCVNDNMLYVCEYGNSKVGVYSLENPNSPTKQYEFSTSADPRHIEVSGRYAFVTCFGADKIEVFDLQNTKSALKIGEIPTADEPKMFVLTGNYIYSISYAGNKIEKFKYSLPDFQTSNFFYQKVGEAVTTCSPLGISYNDSGILAVVGNGNNKVELFGTDNMNLLSSLPFGGAGHGTCLFTTRTQLLVTDWTTSQLLSINCENLLSPVLTGSTNVTGNPEQIEVVGNIAYIPSLLPSSPSYLDYVDISDSKNPVRFMRAQLSVNGAGFTAVHSDGKRTTLYVNGHNSPFNIDVLRIQNGTNIRVKSDIFENISVVNAGISRLNSTTETEAKIYKSVTSNYTLMESDNVLRSNNGTVTLPNPALVKNGKIFYIVNFHASNNINISNPYAGFSSFALKAGEALTIQSVYYLSAWQWDIISYKVSNPISATGTTNYIPKFSSTSTQSISSIFDNGNVGIGTSTPSSYLNYKFLSLNGADGSVLQLRKNDVTFAEIGGDNNFLNIDTFGSAYTKLSILGTEKLRIESTKITSSIPLEIPNSTTNSQAVNQGQLNAIARPYKSYTATMSQTGTSAPVVTVLENTLGGTVVWVRGSTGSYTGTLSGAFPTGKTVVFANTATTSRIITSGTTSTSTVFFLLQDNSGTPTDGSTQISFKAEVYP